MLSYGPRQLPTLVNAVAAVDNGTAVEHDRMRDRQPAQAAGRDSAAVPADVPADRDEVVVAGEDVGEAELPPDLPEARIDVEEDAPPRGREQLRVADEAHDVEEEARLGSSVASASSRESPPSEPPVPSRTQ